MTAYVLDDRRAKAFAEALDSPAAAEAHRNDALGGLLGMVDALGGIPVPTLDPEVRTVQRAQLVAAFEAALAESGGSGFGVPEQRRHRAASRPLLGRLGGSGRGARWGRRLALGGVVAGMALGAFGGVAAASSSALPGDTLYGMKRGLEDWRFGLAGSDAERGRLLLDQASTRMGEAQQLVQRGGGPGRLSPHLVDEVRQVLAEMNSEGTRGRDLLRGIYLRQHSLAPMQRLAAFAAAEQQRLASLTPELPPALDPVAQQVAQMLSGMRDDVAPLHLAGAAPGDGGTSEAASPSSTQTSPHAPTTSGTGSLHGGGRSGSSSSPSGSDVGGLVSGIAGGVLGNGSPTGSASASPSGGGSASAGPSGHGGTGGVSIPPLLPGLLPGVSVGLDGSGG